MVHDREMAVDRRPIVPPLTEKQWHRLVRYGTPVDVAVGDALFRSGDRWYDLILVESGEVEIVRDALPWVDETVIADTAGKFPRLDWVTADFAYARLHGDTELYVSGYDDEALARWEAWIRRHLDAGRDVYAYFDNDVKVRAPYDAMALIERLRS